MAAAGGGGAFGGGAGGGAFGGGAFGGGAGVGGVGGGGAGGGAFGGAAGGGGAGGGGDEQPWLRLPTYAQLLLSSLRATCTTFEDLRERAGTLAKLANDLQTGVIAGNVGILTTAAVKFGHRKVVDIFHERFYPKRGSLQYARDITLRLQSSRPDFDAWILASLDRAQSRPLSSFLQYAGRELNRIKGHIRNAGVNTIVELLELHALNENAEDFLQRAAVLYGPTRDALSYGLAELRQAVAAVTDLVTRFNEEPPAVRHLFSPFTSAGPLVVHIEISKTSYNSKRR
ncbi:translation initiation factor IF-2 isoform X2 [Triticum aestivum]|uniref:translation initiation factor IF-2 isoform X2 n=1 Tax=Triticum aestivum TaxID=4565 RepID=UPI001D018450|nr:translation initiation factor IF-2-like isoform X2 [Triticum aestivum]